MQLSTHLGFNGKCAEAFAFYEKLLGGKILMTMTYGESPMAAQFSRGEQSLVMHTTLAIGEYRLMGADAPGERYKPQQGFAVSLDVQDEAEADRIFDGLAKGGTVQMPIQKTFWAKRFGMVTDRFGTPWMVNCGNPT